MEPARSRVLLGPRKTGMRPRPFVLLLALLALCLIRPDLALAWGPAAHDIVNDLGHPNPASGNPFLF